MDPVKDQKKGKKGRHGLKRKLILSMLLVGVLPLLIGLVMASLRADQEIREVSGANFEAIATETARNLDLVLREELTTTRRITTDSSIIMALEQQRDRARDVESDVIKSVMAQQTVAWSAKDPEMIHTITEGPLTAILQRYYRGSYLDPGYPVPPVTRSATRALFITDIMGRLVASINADVAYAHADEPWWQGAFKKGIGQPYLGNVLFDERLDTYTFTLSLPIMDSIRYQAVGVLHRVYDAKEFFSPSISPIRFGKTGHVMLIDSNGIVMSCPILPTGIRVADANLIPLVTPRQPGWVHAPSDGHGGQHRSIIGFAPLPETSRITQTSTGTAWHMFVWQSSDELFAPIQHLFTWIGLFGLIAFTLLITLGAIAAGRIVRPIVQLQEAARRIGRGEFQESIAVKTGDEIEELAEEVNHMNQQLKSAFAGLTSEVELKTQEVQYLQESTAQILDSVPDPVIMLDQEEHIQYMNKASREAFGVDNGVVEGVNLFHFVKTDDADQKRLRQQLHSICGRSAHADPTQSSPSHLTAEQTLRDPLAPQVASEIDSERNSFHIQGRVYQYEWFSLPSRPEEGQKVGLVMRDTTDESRLQDELIQAEKMASLGVLSAGIGHELNNPLVGVIGLGEAIQDENDPGQVKEYAKKIVHHGRRMATIIQDFTGQARTQTKSRLDQVKINDQLEQALKLVQLAHDVPSLEVRTDYRPLPMINAKPEEIRQVFVNVMTNAIQAMEGKGPLCLSSEASEEGIKVVIRDCGSGIPKSYATKVFDPFFTTKRQGEGAGLGLTIARRIVNKYAGQIQIESEEGQGTVCTITFPSQQPSPPNPAEPEPHKEQGNGQREEEGLHSTS